MGQHADDLINDILDPIEDEIFDEFEHDFIFRRKKRKYKFYEKSSMTLEDFDRLKEKNEQRKRHR